MVFALAIAAGLQLFDRRAGQDQRVGAKDVIDVGPDRRQRIDADDVGRSLGEAVMDRIAVDEERRTSLDNVWAGGDCAATGLDLTVQAVQDGKLAAASISRVFARTAKRAA